MNVDTLSIARDLKATELSSAQAEAIAAAIGRSVSEGTASKVDLEGVRVALKSDIDQVRNGLKSDIDQTRSGLELKIEQLRTEIERSRNQLFVGFVGTQIAFAGIIIAAIRLF